MGVNLSYKNNPNKNNDNHLITDDISCTLMDSFIAVGQLTKELVNPNIKEKDCKLILEKAETMKILIPIQLSIINTMLKAAETRDNFVKPESGLLLPELFGG